MTVRRVEDALASWFTAFDAFPEDQSLQIMRNWLKLFAQLRAHSLIVPYEPRLSGSSWAQAKLELVRVERGWRRRFAESCEVFSVHEVGTNESNKF